MATTNPGHFRTIAATLTLFFACVILALGLSMYHLAHLPDLDAIAQHTAAQAAAPSTKQLMWIQGLALGTSALLLTALLFQLFHHFSAQEAAVGEAHDKARHILSTVNEGLFLLNRELTIGAEHSAALNSILHRENLGGMKLPDLLRNMVPEETRTTALDFVDLLWSDRIEKDLIENINPLDEVEVHFETSGGAYETRYLKFNFKRVTFGTEATYVVVSVTDITEAVELRQALARERAAAGAQIDLLMNTLHVSPLQLHAFIADSEMAVRQANEILKERAFMHEEFRSKIALLFNIVHGIKNDAAGLGLPSIESKVQAFEDELQKLREHRELTGRDLLELPIKLDDFLSHFASIRSLVDRLVTVRGAVDAPSSSAAAEMPQPAISLPIAADLNDDATGLMHRLSLDPIEQTVRPLVERIASDLGKRVTVQTNGLETLPDEYRAAVKDAVVQLVRNAIVHGIELPTDRAKANKPPVGAIKIDASVDTTTNTCFVSVEDDGCGLSAKHILAAAIRKGIVTIEAAKTFSQMKAVLLIFEPGFSTVSQITEHAGRGIGMDIVKTRVEGLGGRIAISGEHGQRTVFRITLPMRRADIAAA